VIWKGACTLVAGATIPFFGFGLKMFAFASSRDGKFHLRCGDASLFEIMRNTPAAFRGEYFSDHVTDYLCDRVSIIRAGRRVETGTLTELRHLTRTSVAAETVRPVPGLDGLVGVHDLEVDGRRSSSRSTPPCSVTRWGWVPHRG